MNINNTNKSHNFNKSLAMKIIISFLEKLQKQVEIHLNSQQIFKEIPVLSHQINNLESCINEFIQTGINLCILILNPLPIRIIPTPTHIAFEDIKLRVQVIESFCPSHSIRQTLGETNTSPSILNTAEHISNILHNFKPSIDGWKGWLTLDETNPWTEIKDPQKSGRYIIEINFHIRGSTIKV